MMNKGTILKTARKYILVIITGLFATGMQASAQDLIPLSNLNPEWSKPYEPFRIAGNLYYVGTYDLACYLITTAQGHILINTGLSNSVPMIRKNVEQLGFDPGDIRILLCTQAHFDHVGGMAEMQQLTKAEMMADEGDAEVLTDGGNSDYALGGKGAMFKSVKVGRILHDRDVVSLGGVRITMLHHPGHTQGSCSYLLDVQDDKGSYRVLIANMPSILPQTKLSGMPGYPEVGRDYAYTLKAMKKLHFDIWCASHASQFALHEKHKPGDAYNPLAFADRKGYDEALDRLQKAYDDKLKEQ
jgi:metallo-beta-lactamase class B